MRILSLIIVTYNSLGYIKKCLDSVLFYNDIGEGLEIIIVDNSDDVNALAMKEFLQANFGDKIIFIKSENNGGYGYGNNLGIQMATGKYLAIMNPDITMIHPLFYDAINQLKANCNIGMLGYKQYGGHNLSFYFRQEYFIPIFTPILTKIFNRFDWFNKGNMYLSGAYFFTTKNIFEQIGNFDENIFLYCEESDITIRFLETGFSIKYDKSKSYVHEIDDRKEMSSSGYKFLLDSSLYYLDKFSFNKHKYFAKLRVELKFKKMMYAILGNNNSKLAVNDQLGQVENTIKTFS